MAHAEVLRPGLLGGRVVLVAGGGPSIATRLGVLGAVVGELPREPHDDADRSAAARAVGPANVLLIDTDAAFRSGAGDGGVPGLRAATDLAWAGVRAVAEGGWVEAGAPPADRCAILIAPRPAGDAAIDAGLAATGAALENLARTLSVEWARHGVRVVAIVPGAGAREPELAELVAFVASSGAAYLAGCVLRPSG